ncbi:MAG: hypothetical protein U0670_18835 [Anaerolineae bacterium]
MSKRFTLLSLLILMIGAVGVLSAQPNAQTVDSALVDTVAGAFAATSASTSLHINTQTAVSRTGGFGGEGAEQQNSASFDLAIGASGWNVSGSRTTITSFNSNQVQSTVQIAVVDGVVYANLDGFAGLAGGFGQPPGGDANGNANGQLPQPPDGAGLTDLPQGWFAVGADANPIVSQLIGADLATRLLAELQLPITTGSVTAISALPDDTIDGQVMHIYQVTLDTQAVLDSGANLVFDNVRGGVPGGFGEGGFRGGRGGDDDDAAQIVLPTLEAGASALPTLPALEGSSGTSTDASGQPVGPDGQTLGEGQVPPDFAQADIDPASTQITFAVYIGADDGLVHRIYGVLSTMRQGRDNETIGTNVTTVIDYSAFNAAPAITAPVVGS